MGPSMRANTSIMVLLSPFHAWRALERCRTWLRLGQQFVKGLDVTLRFGKLEQELGFVGVRLEQLVHNFAIACLVLGSCIIVGLIHAILLGQLHVESHPTVDAHYLTCLSLGVTAVLGVVAFACALISWTGCTIHRFSAVWHERGIVMATSVTLILLVISHNRSLTTLFGYDYDAVWIGAPKLSDSFLLLVIDAFVTVSHLLLPLRWCALFPVEVTGGFLYAFHILRKSEETYPIQNLIVLYCLIAASALGKRDVERHEREKFLEILEERGLRCQAEFKLSSIVEHPSKITGVDVQSEKSSLPTTTNTARVFDTMHASREIGACLDEIVAIGKAEHWFLDKSELVVLPNARLGAGAYGEVLAGSFYGTRVAVKVPTFRGTGAKKWLQSLCNELRILRRLRHPHIVFIHGAIVDVENVQVSLVLEMVDGETLGAFVDRRSAESLSTKVRGQLLVGTCNALWYLHSRNPAVVHGDLKDSNIMVEMSRSDVTPKLLDFGLSRVISRSTPVAGCSLAWTAPETFQTKGRDIKPSADVFTFGHIMFFVLTGMRPFANKRRTFVEWSLLNGSIPSPNWPQRSPLPSLCRGLVEQCFHLDPKERPTMKEMAAAMVTLPGSAIEKPCGFPRRIPNLKETRLDAVVFMLVQLLESWNYSVAPSFCCNFHAGVSELGSLCRALRESPCMPVLGPEVRGQCHMCGVLVTNPHPIESGLHDVMCLHCQAFVSDEDANAESQP